MNYFTIIQNSIRFHKRIASYEIKLKKIKGRIVDNNFLTPP